MLSVLIIICCMCELEVKMADMNKYLPFLLNTLRLMPDKRNQVCEDWDYLSEHIPEHFRLTASKYIVQVFNFLCETEKKYSGWFTAIPVIHFLRKDSLPFQMIELEQDKIQWKDELIDLETVKERHILRCV